MTIVTASPTQHSALDDAQAVMTSLVLASLGLSLLNSGGLVTGGAPGLALLLSYATGWPLGWALFTVNVPFYVLAVRGLGWRFAARTTAAVCGLSVSVELVRSALDIRAVEPLYAALAGGILIGAALLVLFRHQASLGGINVLALALSKRFGWSVGVVQMIVDGAILMVALALLGANKALLSLVGSLAVNAVLVLNHRPGRYLPAP